MSPISLGVPSAEIIPFEPEQDYTCGGTKIIVHLISPFLLNVNFFTMKKVFLFYAASLLSGVALFSQQTNNDSVRMLPLQEVEIISVRAGDKTPVAYSNMDKQEIESYNFGQDIPFLLTLTPSVIATSDAGTGIGYTGFRVRGTDANRINVTANGIPLNDSESHGVFWVNMPDFASSLQDLQVQRGVGTSTNGAGAFGASINMKTENIPSEAYSEWNGGYGSFNTAKAAVKVGTGTLHNHWAFDGRISSITSDGFIDRAGVDLKSYFAQGAYFNENTLLKFITFGGKEKTYHAWDGVPDYILSDKFREGNRTYNPSGYMGDDEMGNPLYYKNQTDNYRQTHYQLSCLQKLHTQLHFNAALHYTKGLGYYEEYKRNRTLEEYGITIPVVEKSDLVRQKHLDNDFYGGIFSLDYKPNRWTVSFGGGANQYIGEHFGKVIWVKEQPGDTGSEYYRSKGKKTDVNLYLKGNYQLTDALNLYGDMQYRFINYRIEGENDVWDWNKNAMQELEVHEKFRFFNPKTGVFYRFHRAHSAYASFAIAHREPNRNNYTDAGETEIPRPERLLDYELGYQFRNRIFTAGFNAYYMRYKDQLVLTGKVNEIGEPLTSNVPDSYRMGLELSLGAQISSQLKWNGNLTWSKNRILNYTEYVLVDDGYAPQQADYYGTTPIAYSPDWIANSLLTYTYQSFSAGFHSTYVSKQYLDNTGNDDRRIDAYFVNNLRLGYDFRLKGVKKISVNLLINNFFNTEYETNCWVGAAYYHNADGKLEPYVEKGYFPQAGRHILLHLTVAF